MNASVASLPADEKVKGTSSPGSAKAFAGADSSLDAMVNILLVDDDPRNLDVLESVLISSDRRLVRAQSADQALLALVQGEFAAIVLDIQMPGMSGFELAKLIKQRRRNQYIPIIFLTAYFQEDKDVLSGYDVGAVDYLTKPVDPQILKSKVNVFVELFRSNRALVATNSMLESEIAERKQAELARDRLAAIVESSADAILSETQEGVITSWNRGAQRMFGHTADEIVGCSISLLVPPDRNDELAVLLGRMEREEAVEPLETVRLRKDGRPVDVSLVLSPIKDEKGRLLGTSSIMRDISERKRLEAEILQVSEREQHRIAADLHDGLGQQLGGISCLSDVLKKDLADQGSSEAAAASKISRLLNIAMAQTRSLARGLHPVAPEANGLMSSLEELAARVADLFKVACRFECLEPVLVKKNAAATHLYRIVQEAVTNAIKHGRAQRIDITLSSLPDRIILTVSDDGVGFNGTERPRKGLGLRIMKHRANVINGTLVVQSRAGGGTNVICSMLKDSDLERTD